LEADTAGNDPPAEARWRAARQFSILPDGNLFMTLLNHFRSTSAIGFPVLLLAMGLATPFVVEAAGNLADGWSVRADSGAGQDNKLTVESGTFQFTMAGPPSNNGTFYNP
jgi:hypothetical protein